MKIADALACGLDLPTLTAELTDRLTAGLEGATPDLVLLFATMPLQPLLGELATHLRHRLGARHLLAMTAQSVLGIDREIENLPAVSALALSLPHVVLDTFHFAEEEWPELLGERGTLLNRLEAGPDLRAFLMFGEPFSTPIVPLLDVCSRLFPQAPIIGGMASGCRQSGETRLIVDEQIFSSGLVGISLAGGVQIDPVVSQGCRPVGRCLVITRGHKNLIEELDGEPPLEVLEKMLAEISSLDRELIHRQGLQIGRVIDEGKGNFGRGDFLIRSLIGMERQSGALAIGDLIRTGQTVQFHVRDAQSAHEELRLLLEGELQLAGDPAGVLLLSCNGRGAQLFERPNHDVQTACEVLGNVPVAGCFCAGEFGPVDRRNFIHGHTASLALFREPS